MIDEINEIDEENENSLINDVIYKIKEMQELIDSEEFTLAEELSNNIDFDLENIEDYLSSLEDKANEYELSISNYENQLASNQCNIDTEIYSQDELYHNLEDEDIDEYNEKLDEVSSEYELINTAYDNLNEEYTEITNLRIEREEEYNEKLIQDNEEVVQYQIELENKNKQELEKNIIKKGNEGEEAFLKWLNQNNFSFIYVHQDKKTFATLFKNALKRPDFLILIDGIGLIAVDIKNIKEFNGAYSLPIKNELKKTLTFERTFRMPVWYVYANNQKFDKWFWINSLKVVEVAEIKTNRNTEEDFYLISKEYFTEIKDNNDFGKLWTQRLNCLKNINSI